MPEPVAANNAVSEPVREYNPLSKMAILAVSCSGLFALILVMGTLTALIQNTPLLDLGPLLILPLIGAGLALLAQRRIRNSDKTLEGLSLAKWALWLAVLGGLGYGAYFLATGLAIQAQANRFVMEEGEDAGFVPLLMKGDLKRAFLLTLPLSERKGVDPDDPEKWKRFEIAPDPKLAKGPFGAFVDSEFIQLILLAAKEESPLQPQGIRKWAYEKGEFVVERNYRIETKEVVADLLIPVKSNDSQAGGESRKWQVDWQSVTWTIYPQHTPLGFKISRLRQEAGKTLDDFLDTVRRGKMEAPFPADATKWEKVTFPSPALKDRIQKELVGFIKGQDTTPRQPKTMPQGMAPWVQDDGHIQFTFYMSLTVPHPPKGNEPQYAADMLAKVRSKEPVDLATLSEGLDWQVASLQVIQFRSLAPPSSSEK